MSEITVTDNPDQSRYEAYVDGDLAGFADYELREDVIAFTHTEVDSAFSGQGVGGALARGALDHVRDTGGLTVVPECPFIARWIGKHPDYESLLADATR